MTDAAPDTGEATTTDTTETDASTDTEQAKDWKAEAEKWQTLARKHEDRAKSNADAAKELEKVRRESMTEQERIADEARQAGRAEALTEVASDRVDDAVRVAVAGRGVDVEALLEGLDRRRFITDDHRPDTDAIQAWVDRIAPQAEETDPVFPDLGQGARGGASMALNGDPLLRDLKSKLGVR